MINIKRSLLVACCILLSCASVALAALAVAPVAAVKAFSGNDGLEEFLIKEGIYLEGETKEDDSDTIIIKPLSYPATIELYNVTFTEDDKVIRDDKAYFTIELTKGGFIMSTVIAEGISNLIVGVKAGGEKTRFWMPAYSGVDGLLIIAEGFIRW